ncbi:MAG: hemolysin family protein [Candidatus Sumerlaeia bacterium]
MILFYLIAIVCLLALSAYFSGSETAVISSNRMRLYSMHLEGEREATEALELLNDTQRLVAVVLVGNNMALVLMSLLAREAAYSLAPASWKEQTFLTFNYVELAVLATLTPIVLLAAEIVPKQVFLARADQFILRLQSSLRVASFVFMPLVKGVNAATNLALRPLGIGRRSPLQQLDREEMVEILKNFTPADTGETVFPREMIYNIFQLKKTLVREVMRPIVDVVALRLETATLAGLLEVARKTGYSRYPVFRDRIVNMIGFVDIYKVLRDQNEQKTLADYIEPAIFIPEIAPVDSLLQLLLEKGNNVAIVIDEFGGCSGWVSLEDIFEEIVGEIHDEFDTSPAPGLEVVEDGYLIDAQFDIDDLNDELKLSLPKLNCETVGGLIYSKLARVPAVGESVTIEEAGGVCLQVVEMTGPKILRVRLTRPSTKSEAGEDDHSSS